MDGRPNSAGNSYLAERLKDFDEFGDLDSVEYIWESEYGDGMNAYFEEFEAAANAGEEANVALNLVQSSSIPATSATIAIGGVAVATLLAILVVL